MKKPDDPRAEGMGYQAVNVLFTFMVFLDSVCPLPGYAFAKN